MYCVYVYLFGYFGDISIFFYHAMKNNFVAAKRKFDNCIIFMLVDIYIYLFFKFKFTMMSLVSDIHGIELVNVYINI